MLGPLRDIFRGVRGTAAAAIIAASMALASFSGAALGQEQVAAAGAPASKGKPVVLRVGPGFDVNDANLTAAALNSKRGVPRRW